MGVKRCLLLWGKNKNYKCMKAKYPGSRKDEVSNLRDYIAVDYIIYIGRLVLLWQRNLNDMMGGECRSDGEDKEFIQNSGRGTY
jgi:hypothetical protein